MLDTAEQPVREALAIASIGTFHSAKYPEECGSTAETAHSVGRTGECGVMQ